MHFEYMVVPAPRKGLKGKGVKGNEARFAFAIQTLMNEHAVQGWEFVRAEVLPSDERQGLTSSHTVYRDLLVFRRPRAEEQVPVNPEPVYSEPLTEEPEEPEPEDTPSPIGAEEETPTWEEPEAPRRD